MEYLPMVKWEGTMSVTLPGPTMMPDKNSKTPPGAAWTTPCTVIGALGDD